MKVETIQGLVFSGGSAFGLAAADGVVREIAAEGRGHPTPAGPVPIVPSAIIYDLLIGDGTVRPGPAEGAAAYHGPGRRSCGDGQRWCRNRRRRGRVARRRGGPQGRGRLGRNDGR